MRILGVVLVTGCFIKPNPALDDGGHGSGDGGSTVDARLGSDDGSYNLAFVSSGLDTPFTPADADAKCASDDPAHGVFVAWLADVARRRPGDLIAGARGWIRPDGKPVADLPGDFAAGRLLNTISTDVTGTVSVGGMVLTNTKANGMYVGNVAPCTEGGTDARELGQTTTTTTYWTQTALAYCTGDPPSYQFYCLGIDHDTPLPARTVMAPIAFVTKGVFTSGNLDSFCTSDANDGHMYRALVARNNMAANDSFSDMTFMRPDHVVVTTNKFATLLAPINETLDGTYTSEHVYLGASSFSTAGTAGTDCSDWMSASATAVGTYIDASDQTARPQTLSKCSVGKHLICIPLDLTP